MSKRHAREHGRILSVDEETLGSVLVDDAASGATTLYVDDAAEFEDDGSGGWLSINDQVIEYDTVDDDAGTIHLKTGLTAAADDGDPVYVWSKLYDTAATVKTALVMVDGEDENDDPVHATLADSVQDLPEGIRGGAGESCTLLRVSDDEWEITAVAGRPSSSKGGQAIRFEDQNTFTAAADGDQAFILSHRPAQGSVHLDIGGVPQPHTEFTVDYDTGQIDIPDDLGLFSAGDTFDFRYAYLVGVQAVPISGGESVSFGSGGWDYATNAISDTTWPSTWNTGGAAPFGSPVGSAGVFGWPAPVTSWSGVSGIWLRRTVSGSGPAAVAVRGDDGGSVWWNGVQVLDSTDTSASQDTVAIPTSLLQDTNVVMVHVTNFSGNSYADVEVARG